VPRRLLLLRLLLLRLLLLRLLLLRLLLLRLLLLANNKENMTQARDGFIQSLKDIKVGEK